jgi:hypothetical protein
MTCRPTAVLPILCALVAISAEAKENDPEIRLTWSPQQRVATAQADVSADMLTLPVALEVTDERGLEDPAALGTRTDDADREWRLLSVEPIEAFIGRSTAAALEDWGIDVRADAERTLTLAVLRFRVVESNQAVGATYEAQCRLEGALRDARGTVLWSGDATGDATRYGRKLSEANVSEVLSDALLEALGTLLGDRGLHRAWVGEPAVAAPADAVSPVIAPEELLAELRRLVEGGVGEEQLVRFVTGRRLTRPLDADDVLAWRDAGLPDAVVAAALDLPVR